MQIYGVIYRLHLLQESVTAEHFWLIWQAQVTGRMERDSGQERMRQMFRNG